MKCLNSLPAGVTYKVATSKFNTCDAANQCITGECGVAMFFYSGQTVICSDRILGRCIKPVTPLPAPKPADSRPAPSGPLA